MGCFTAPLADGAVANTRIFARALPSGRQVLVCSLELAASEELALVLPLPVPSSATQGAVRFIKLKGYPELFVDLRKGFPDAEPLRVQRVGSFEAAYVPRAEDFARLDARLRLPAGLLEGLPLYGDYGFAVFAFRDAAKSPGMRTIPPMALEFERRDPHSLFFPTLQLHEEGARAKARFDHTLYCQVDPAFLPSLPTWWTPSAAPARAFLDVARAGELFDPNLPCHRMTLSGLLKNEDTHVALRTPRSAAPPLLAPLARGAPRAQAATAPAGAAAAPPPPISFQSARKVEGDSLGRTAVDVVPGSLRVHVERHRLQIRDRVLPCTSYLSDGLRAAGQCEIAFTTLDEQEGEGPLRPVLDFYAHVLRSAQTGQRLEAGDVTEFQARGFPWGQGEFSGLVFTHALPMPEVTMPPAPALTAIALTPEELQAVRAFGACRVLARFAVIHRYFPCPPWADRRRRTLVSLNALQPSCLSDAPRLMLRGSALLEGARLRIRIRERSAPLLREAFSAFPASAPPAVALLVQIDPEADACLAWKASQAGAEGIAREEGKRALVSGSFVLLEHRADGIEIVEDGFVVGLAAPTWRSLLSAVAAGKGMDGPATPLRWALEWLPDELPSWAASEARPASAAAAPTPTLAFAGATVLRRLSLLCPEELAARAAKPDRLAAYVETVKRAVESHFSGETAGSHDLVIDFELPTSLRVAVQVSARPALPADLLEDLAARLRVIQSPLVREAGLGFRLEFAIKGGAAAEPDQQGTQERRDEPVQPTAAMTSAGPDFIAGQLAEAEMFVEYGMVDKAVERLGAILAQSPGHTAARAVLARIRGAAIPDSAELTPRRPNRPRGEAARFADGDRIADRFRVVRFLARGGMGDVYEVADEELGEHVALKTIRPEIAQDELSLARFKREISLARRIAHPNVCRIFEFGLHRSEDQEDTAFLTMELLLGESLAQRIERGRMLAPQALPIVTQMCAGLGAAHRMGVVHRDFKSPNVMLVGAEQQLRAVVTDFGLARKGDASASITDSGVVVGTPAYMAPEQVEDGEITPAVDIYALGIVIYEMVTGQLPFDGDTPMSVAIKRLREPPPRPRKLIPDLDSTWEAVILLCLERDPAKRFATAEDVAKELSAH